MGQHDIAATVSHAINATYGFRTALDDIVAPLRHFHYDVFEIGDPGNIVPLSGLIAFSTNIKGEVDQLTVPLEPSVKPIVFKRVP